MPSSRHVFFWSLCLATTSASCMELSRSILFKSPKDKLLLLINLKQLDPLNNAPSIPDASKVLKQNVLADLEQSSDYKLTAINPEFGTNNWFNNPLSSFIDDTNKQSATELNNSIRSIEPESLLNVLAQSCILAQKSGDLNQKNCNKEKIHQLAQDIMSYSRSNDLAKITLHELTQALDLIITLAKATFTKKSLEEAWLQSLKASIDEVKAFFQKADSQKPLLEVLKERIIDIYKNKKDAKSVFNCYFKAQERIGKRLFFLLEIKHILQVHESDHLVHFTSHDCGHIFNDSLDINKILQSMKEKLNARANSDSETCDIKKYLIEKLDYTIIDAAYCKNFKSWPAGDGYLMVCGVVDTEFIQQVLDTKKKFLLGVIAITCGNCNSKASQENPLLLCSRCKQVRYCNRECQKKHWFQHKQECKSPLAP